MNKKINVDTITTSTSGTYVQSTYIAVGGLMPTFSVTSDDLMSKPKADIQKAVYAHIRALRALGRTTVNTLEVARALGIRVRDVDGALGALKSKGVKVAA